SVTDTHCRWLLERCVAAGLEVVVWQMTQDVSVPCFLCTLVDRDAKTYFPRRASGSGCHPYRRIALMRAITEALQSRLPFTAGGRDDAYWSVYKGSRADDEAGRASSYALLAEAACIDFDDVAEAPRMSSIEALLEWIVGKLADAGLAEIVVVDLTRTEI